MQTIWQPNLFYIVWMVAQSRKEYAWHPRSNLHTQEIAGTLKKKNIYACPAKLLVFIDGVMAMEALSVLLVLCEGNPPVTGGFAPHL